MQEIFPWLLTDYTYFFCSCIPSKPGKTDMNFAPTMNGSHKFAILGSPFVQDRKDKNALTYTYRNMSKSVVVLSSG